MTLPSTKAVALSAVFAFGSLMSGAAHAGVLYSSNGNPVTTKEGVAVLVAEDSVDVCDAEAQARAAQLAALAEQARRERTVYFEYNKSALTKDAKSHLMALAEKLRGQKGKSIAVIGFADRMGNAAYNERLALKRAKAVRDFLVAKGIKAKTVEVRSLGKSVPRANCAEGMARPELIKCLSEDRRVEVEVK